MTYVRRTVKRIKLAINLCVCVSTVITHPALTSLPEAKEALHVRLHELGLIHRDGKFSSAVHYNNTRKTDDTELLGVSNRSPTRSITDAYRCYGGSRRIG